jgi:hypothetical protein
LRPEWILEDVFRSQLLDGQEQTLAAFADTPWQSVDPEVLAVGVKVVVA